MKLSSGDAVCFGEHRATVAPETVSEMSTRHVQSIHTVAENYDSLPGQSRLQGSIFRACYAAHPKSRILTSPDCRAVRFVAVAEGTAAMRT